MSHYFTDNSELAQNRKEISFRFLNTIYTFTTDNGVFCKTEVDFGSYVLLKTLSKEKIGKRVLDLGCGYGPIGIVIKSLNPDSSVMMVDVNPRAVELSKINCKKNKTDNEVRVSYIYDNVPETFDTIITNPPIRAGKEVIYSMFEKAYDHLDENGCLYVVIRKQQGAESAKKKIETIFGNCSVIEKEKGYFILKSNKAIDK